MSHIVHWSDYLDPHKRRRHWLLFLKDGKAVRFLGKDIEGIVTVMGNKKDKVSTEGGLELGVTHYQLKVVNDVRMIGGFYGGNDDVSAEKRSTIAGYRVPDTWEGLSKALGVSLESTVEFAEQWLPNLSKELSPVKEATAEFG